MEVDLGIANVIGLILIVGGAIAMATIGRKRQQNK
jgi:hypothetical protein